MRDSAAMSQTCMRGLVGDSSISSRVRPGTSAARTALGPGSWTLYDAHARHPCQPDTRYCLIVHVSSVARTRVVTKSTLHDTSRDAPFLGQKHLQCACMSNARVA